MSPTSERSTAAGRWISFRRDRPAARLRLFCFPHAGGGASTYRHWPAALPESIDVCPVQPPGRENRIREEPCSTMDELVAAADGALAPLLDRPFALFGHSLGATVAYEWAQRLERRGAPAPRMLLASARAAPTAPLRFEPMFDLPLDAFKSRLAELAGTPAEILDNEEMMEILLPMLRADFEIHDTYRWRERPPLRCPIRVFGGRDDPAVSREELDAWHQVTTAPVAVEILPGDHFSLLADGTLLDRVADALADLAR